MYQEHLILYIQVTGIIAWSCICLVLFHVYFIINPVNEEEGSRRLKIPRIWCFITNFKSIKEDEEGSKYYRFLYWTNLIGLISMMAFVFLFSAKLMLGFLTDQWKIEDWNNWNDFVNFDLSVILPKDKLKKYRDIKVSNKSLPSDRNAKNKFQKRNWKL